MKKNFWVAFLSLILVLALSLTVMANNKRYAVIRPGVPGQQSDVIFMTPSELNSPNVVQLIQKRFAKLSASEGIIDTLKHTFSGVNFGFADGDTMAAFFRPPAGCIVKSVIMTFGKWSGQLTSAINLSIYSSNYHATEIPDSMLYGNFSPINLGWWTASGNWAPQVPFSFYPLGDLLWGDFPISLDPSKDSQTIDTPMIYLGFEPDVKRNDFMIVARPVQGSGQEYTGISAGSANGDPMLVGFKCYHAGRVGETTTPSWWIREYAWTVWVVVEFYENTPPSIDITKMPNTFSTGPFTAKAMIKDLDAHDATQAGVAEAYLHYSTNGAAWDSVAMSGPASGGEYSAVIPAVTAPTFVYYYMTAKDPPGLYTTTAAAPKKFYVGNLTGSNILLFNQGGGYASVYDSVYINDLDALGYKYDYMFGSVDGTVKAENYKYVIVPANGNPMPSLSDSLGLNKFVTLLDNGGNLLVSSDEAFGYYTYGWPGDTLATPGGFFHDYLHVKEEYSDAPYDKILDVAGDGFADALTDTIKLTFPSGVENYSDAVLPTADGSMLFTVTPDTFASKTGGNVNGAGILYNGTYKVVYLPFILATLNQNDRQTIMKSALDFFGAPSVVSKENTTSPYTYTLHQNYPNPFNPTTNISYSVAKAGQVNVAVFNVIGEKIAELVNGYKTAGSYGVTWNGKDNAGQNVASGVYFYRIKAGNFTMTKKMVLMR